MKPGFKIILSANRIASALFGAYAVLSLFASGSLVLVNGVIFFIFLLNVHLLTTSTVRNKTYLDRYKFYKVVALLGNIAIIAFYSWIPVRVIFGNRPQYFNPASYFFLILILIILIPTIVQLYKSTLRLEGEAKAK